jgi:polyisoprenoid-binding protein YceI
MIKAFIIFAALISGEAKEKEIKVNTEASKIGWYGTKIVGNSHTGTIALKEGSLKMDGKELTGGSFIIDMKTIKESKDSEKLVGHLKSDDFFGVATYPTTAFTITSVKSNGNGSYDVTGDLTIKASTESITFPAKVVATKDGYEATATITFDRSKFDVRYGSDSFFDNLGDKAISNDIKLEVSLVTGK